MSSSKRSLPIFHPLARTLLGVTLLAVAAVGCSQREEITRYKVDKPAPLEPVASASGRPEMPPGHPEIPAAAPTGEPTDRMLGVVVPTSPQGWFFKLSGPKEAVAAQEDAFRNLLASVKFAGDGKPSWTLPEGWQEEPGGAIRFATLRIPGNGKPLEVSVTALPNSGDDNDNYVLQNVNRWRGQLQLEPIDAAQLPDESTPVEVDGTTATLVNLVGHASAGSMGRPPFFSGAPDGN